ncbi:glycosyltransferase family 4 protein [Candidatus Fermentibacteria bacterium]|nr:glycosyltransferase family 4 protein [Candidatus Fermentibacteria bacterium]
MIHRIGIDISRTLGQPGGVGLFADRFVRALVRVDTTNRYTLYPFFWFCHPPDYRQAFKPKTRNFRLHDQNRSFETLRRRWSGEDLPPRELLGPVELLHSPGYTAPYVPGIRLCVTIHDMSFLTHPHFHTEENRKFCMVQSLRAARLADAILCDSQSTADDVRRYLHVPLDRLFVIPGAAGPEFRRLEDSQAIALTLLRLGITENFLLFVGSVEPRKNLSALIEAFARLKLGSQRPEWLVIAGGTGWKNEQIYERVRELKLEHAVRFLGYLPVEDLVVLYNACRAFVYPSLYEGFGLPVLEAMSCGAPVVSSGVSSLPEVAGDAALLIDPHDGDALVEAMEAVLDDAGLRATLRAKGVEQASRFSWEQTARLTVEVYQRFLS